MIGEKVPIYILVGLFVGILLMYFAASPVIRSANVRTSEAVDALEEVSASYEVLSDELARNEEALTALVDLNDDLEIHADSLEQENAGLYLASVEANDLALHQDGTIDRLEQEARYLRHELEAAGEDTDTLEAALSQLSLAGEDIKTTKSRMLISLAMYKFVYAKELGMQAVVVGMVYPQMLLEGIGPVTESMAQHLEGGIYLLNQVPSSQLPPAIRDFKAEMQHSYQLFLQAHEDECSPRCMMQAIKLYIQAFDKLDRDVVNELESWNLYPAVTIKSVND